MTDTIRVRVTQADIDAGWRESCTECPYAVAIRRVTGKEYVSVGKGDAIVGCDYYRLSKASKRRIRAYDHDEPMEPHTFVMRRVN